MPDRLFCLITEFTTPETARARRGLRPRVCTDSQRKGKLHSGATAVYTYVRTKERKPDS